MSARPRRRSRGADRLSSPPAAELSQRRWRAWLLGIAIGAFALRLIHVISLARTPLFELLLEDSKRYVEWASEIAAGDLIGSGVFYQAPLYPYALAVPFALTGDSIQLVRVLQSIGGALACVLVTLAGRRFFDWRVGVAAGICLALYPPAIFFDGLIQKSSLDLLLMAVVIWAASGYVSDRRDRWLVVLGLALGCFMLNRENARALFPFLALWVAAWNHDLRWVRRLRAAGVFTLATLVPIAPVAARNYAVGGAALISTSQLGPNFYIGNHVGASGVYEPLVANRGSVEFEQQDAVKLATDALGRPLTASEVSDYWLSKALEEMRTDPPGWVRLLGRKMLLAVNRIEAMDTESIEFHAGYSPVLGLHRFLSFGVLLTLAVFGIAITAADYRRLAVLYGIAAIFLMSIALFFVLARYRYPVVAVLVLFAGAGLAHAGAAWRLRRRHAVVGLACAAALGFVANTPMRVSSEETYTNFGTELLRANRPAEAIPLLVKAVELHPDDPAVHRDLAIAYERAGDPAAAAREYGAIVQLLVAWAAREVRSGRFDQAIVALEEAAVAAHLTGQPAMVADVEQTITAVRARLARER